MAGLFAGPIPPPPDLKRIPLKRMLQGVRYVRA
jgi:hypothetical protein